MHRPPKPVKRPTAEDPPDPRITRPPPHIFSDAEIVRRLTRANALDPKLAPTDRHMQRWAVGQGSGIPDADRALFAASRLTPLAPEVDIKTDQIVLAAPGYWPRFITRWYRSDCSVQQLEAEFGMKRDKLFVERRVVLGYLLGQLKAAGIQLATFEPTP